MPPPAGPQSLPPTLSPTSRLRSSRVTVSPSQVNLATEAGVPQGALAAERNTLQAIVKVIAPSAFAQAFAHGSKRGVLALPFCATRCPSNPHRPRPPP